MMNHLEEAKKFTDMSRNWTPGQASYDPFIIEVAKVDALIAIAEQLVEFNMLYTRKAEAEGTWIIKDPK